MLQHQVLIQARIALSDSMDAILGLRVDPWRPRQVHQDHPGGVGQGDRYSSCLDRHGYAP